MQPRDRELVPASVSPELRQFIDTAVVPALLERFLREMKRREGEAAGTSVPAVALSGERV